MAQAVEVRSDVAGAARSGEPSRVERRDVTGDVLAGQGPTPGVPGSEGAQRRVTGLANVCLCCMCVDTSFEICGHLPIFIGITTSKVETQASRRAPGHGRHGRCAPRGAGGRAVCANLELAAPELTPL